MPEIRVIHLVWGPLGLLPFASFLTSYKRNPGKAEHRLVVIFNGIADQHELHPYQRLLDGVDYDFLVMPRPTLDIPAYLAAAQEFDSRFLCFLNSYSVILDAEWLAKLYTHLARADVGLVGASGSWESHYTSAMQQMLGWGIRSLIRSTAGRLSRGALPDPRPHLSRWRQAARLRRRFAPFPNPHIRTNAFMVRRDLLLQLDRASIHSKTDAEAFESGKQGLTRHVLAMKLRALVVGRDGKAYEPQEWHRSRTFRSGDQGNLLVADNRTRQYAEADPETQVMLRKLAWGRA